MFFVKVMLRCCIGSLLWLLVCASSIAFPVGERHLIAEEASAVSRDDRRSPQLRVTVWYPAAQGSLEEALTIGPPGHTLYESGSAARNADFGDATRRPVVLLSHGFGGSARMIAWFGTALARAGYVVIAVDHPGNNGMDPMTVTGALLFWDRPADLATALAAAKMDRTLSAHMDLARIGVAGFSAGGFTGLAAVGGRVDLAHLQTFCLANPNDGVCQPQRELNITFAQAQKLLAAPELAAELAGAGGDLHIDGVKAAFVMAPALVESFEPTSLQRIGLPVEILLGDADSVAPPESNGELAAALIPGARIKILPKVGHYDFLASCTAAGAAVVPVCLTKVPRDETHAVAIQEALNFFDQEL